MHPLIFKIGPITIYSYGVMVASAFLVSTILCFKEAEKLRINKDVIVDLAFLIMVFGILGARGFYVLLNLKEYLNFPLEVIKIYKGGLVLYGGILGGVLSCLIYLKRKRLPTLKIADLIFPYVALGQSMGRMGCFLNGCCYGKLSKFGLYFPVHRAILLPTQLYSSLGDLLICLILRSIYKKRKFDGQIFLLYFILYPLKRFLIEFLRADTKNLIFNLTFFQILSLIILITSTTIYLRCKKLISV